MANSSIASEIQYNNAKPWQLVAFAFNNSATNAQYFMYLMFFIYYCTDSLGLSAMIVGGMMTFSRIFDAFIDPMVGLMIDKTNTRFGKFRPFMFAGMIIMNISTIGLYWGLQVDNNIAMYAWIAVCYVIWNVGYTCSTICTKSAQNVLTNNPKQRPLVSGIDQVIMTGLDILIFSFGMIILNYFGGVEDPASFRNFAFMIAGFTTLFTIFAMAGIWKKDNENYYEVKDMTKKENQLKVRDFISIIKGNKALQMLIVAGSSTKIATTIQSSATAYFFMIVMGGAEFQAIVNGPATFVSLAGAFIGVGLAIYLGLKKSFVVGQILSIVAAAILLVIRPFDAGSVVLAVVLISFFRLAERMADTNQIPMIADVADYELWKNGRFIPSMIATTFSFVDKMVSSLSGLLLGAVLGAAHYTAGMEVTSTLYWSILGLYFGAPLIAHIIALLAMKKYPINKEFYEKMTRENNERKAKAEMGA